MPNTNYYAIIDDAHGRGAVAGSGTGTPETIDPALGQYIETLAAPTVAPTINTVVTGVTSGAKGRVIAVVSSTGFVLEALSVSFLFGLPKAFTPSETLNFDNGGTATMSFVGFSQSYPSAKQYGLEHFDAELNSFIPDDKSDTPFFDPYAKDARSILLDGTTITAGENSFIQGNRFTTSGGASGTILAAQNAGTDYRIWIMRSSGTYAINDVLTMDGTGHNATIKSVTGSDADTVQGTWVYYHRMPNQNGTPASNIWEFPPQGGRQGTSSGGPTPIDLFLRRAFDHHKAASDVGDRGTRVVPFNPSGNNALGGVTLQVVPCSGTFPASGTFTVGETVTGPGGWSGKVHGVNNALKYIFVYGTNGQTLTAGTVTGATSTATATATGAAIGWQKGSSHWNGMVARFSTALARPGALYSGNAAAWRGLFLMIWESELGSYHPTNGALWPTVTQAQAEFVRFAADLRAHLGVADLPIALWNGDTRSHASDINFLGIPYAYYLQQIMEGLPSLIPGLRLVRSDGFQPNQTTGLPRLTSLLWFRPQDYLALGERGWNALRGVSPASLSTLPEVLPILAVGGQSQQVGSVNAQKFIDADRDPLLFPSSQFGTFTGFPGLDTTDPDLLQWNSTTGAIEVYDATKGNTFFGMPAGTFGPEVVFGKRMKARYGSKLCIAKFAVNASSVNANARQALATWDPAQPNRITAVASMTVTAHAATSLLPQRGRFTAAAGTFNEWDVGDATSVAGSALGLVGFGGNDTSQFLVAYVVAKAADHSWIELGGAFVAEGPRSYTLSLGPIPLAPLVEAQVKALIAAALAQNKIPLLIGVVWENGESDIFNASEYQDALQRTLAWFINLFGARPKGLPAVPKVLVQLSAETPFSTTTDINAIRGVQTTVAAALGNTAVVDPSDLPLEPSGQWPIDDRSKHGVHRTARGHIELGARVDSAFGNLQGIPAAA